MFKVLISAVTLLASTAASAQELGGVTLGMTADQAVAAMSRYGTPKNVSLTGGSDRLVYTDEFNAKICKGRVISVSHALAPTFAAFARTMKVAILTRGEPSYTVDSTEGARQISQISANWPRVNGARYAVSYFEIDGEKVVSESYGRLC